MRLHDERYPHEPKCKECAHEGVCNHCGKPAQLERCTNGRCGACHDLVCGVGTRGTGVHPASKEGDPLYAQLDQARFMERFRKVPAHVVARAVGTVTPGLNWAHCSKGHIAERWALARNGTHRQRAGYEALARATLDDIQAAVQLELSPRVPRG